MLVGSFALLDELLEPPQATSPISANVTSTTPIKLGCGRVRRRFSYLISTPPPTTDW